MNKRAKAKQSASKTLGYTLPKLHTGKEWYIDFRCFCPTDGTMKRKKYHFRCYKKLTEKRAYANKLIKRITEKLEKGWNVWAEHSNAKEYTHFYDVFDIYIKTITREKESGILRLKTFQSHLSMIKVFQEWVEKHNEPLIYIYQFNKEIALEFLDYIFIEKRRTARTRNNYKTFLYGFSEWLIEKNYLEENPVIDIKKMREEQKNRNAFTPQQMQKLKKHLTETKQNYFLFACMMEYYTFIRPRELTFLKIGDIKLKEQKIIVHASFAKNKRDEAVAINERLVKMILDLKILEKPSNWFLFGKKFAPAPEQAPDRIFRDKFARIRKKLKWGKDLQFYSLKDSGLRDLANSVGIVIARDQARHTDISTTNRYLKCDFLSVHTEAKTFEGEL